jgi:hypothetical protein
VVAPGPASERLALQKAISQAIDAKFPRLPGLPVRKGPAGTAMYHTRSSGAWYNTTDTRREWIVMGSHPPDKEVIFG